MESYEAINGCSDKYVALPGHLADQVLDSQRYIVKIPPLSYVVLVLCAINLFAEFAARLYVHKHDGHFERF